MKYLILSFVVVTFLFACEDKQVQQNVDWVTVDDGLIQEYLADQNITAEKHASGIYYEITKEGNGQHPNATSFVKLNYKGYLLYGTVFDQNDEATLSLANVIQGWQIGIPLISKGGSGVLYIPSYYAYGSSSPSPDIPANSILVFEVDLINF